MKLDEEISRLINKLEFNVQLFWLFSPWGGCSLFLLSECLFVGLSAGWHKNHWTDLWAQNRTSLTVQDTETGPGCFLTFLKCCDSEFFSTCWFVSQGTFNESGGRFDVCGWFLWARTQERCWALAEVCALLNAVLVLCFSWRLTYCYCL